MNICIFARGLPSDIDGVIGGMEIHTQELIKGLIKKGHKVALICLIAPGHPRGSVEYRGGLRIFYVGERQWVTKNFFKEAAEAFKKLNEDEKFDLVNSEEIGYGFSFAQFCSEDIPFIVTVHEVFMRKMRDEARRSLKDLIITGNKYLRYRIFFDRRYRIILNKATKIIAVGMQQSYDLKREYNIPDDKLKIVSNGIDTDLFRPGFAEDLKTKLNLSGEKIIVAPGRIDKYKGFDVLLYAFHNLLKRFENTKLIIIGNGPFQMDLEKLAYNGNIKDRVLFAGRIPYEDMPKYYNIADVIAFPTLRTESFGLVALEAMSCGKSIVASRIGGIMEIIEDGMDGILVEPGDVSDLENKLQNILGDESLRTELGKNARKKIINKFSLDRMVDETINVYQEVLNGPKKTT